MPSNQPNVVFLLADQLRAASLPMYGERQIETPHLDRLASEGVVFENALSTCPVCSPYRSMLVTGRHPQTTGHVLNFVESRDGEISVADAFNQAGYRTAWVGKWHLAVGGWPGAAMGEGEEGPCYVPEGRPRLGFEHWRAYNFHEQYFDGWVNKNHWRNEMWKGYETEALNRYAIEFMESAGDDPFCLFVSPHQPHYTTRGPFAPERYYERVPETPSLPDNVPEEMRDSVAQEYRHYLAMTLALDDMAGELLDWLDRSGRAEDTIFVFASDHGSQFGAHGVAPWQKGIFYEESLRVPLIARGPGGLRGGVRRDPILTPVDIFPSLCGLCGVPVPRSVEGRDLSAAMGGQPDAPERDAALGMGFGGNYCFVKPEELPPTNRQPWRAVRTKRHCYARFLDGTTELYDLAQDPLEMENLSGRPEAREVEDWMEARLGELLRERGDGVLPAETYADWFDARRRIVRNAFGPLPSADAPPDWSLLE